MILPDFIDELSVTEKQFRFGPDGEPLEHNAQLV
jgi:hypothetical protein